MQKNLTPKKCPQVEVTDAPNKVTVEMGIETVESKDPNSVKCEFTMPITYGLGTDPDKCKTMVTETLRTPSYTFKTKSGVPLFTVEAATPEGDQHDLGVSCAMTNDVKVGG